MELSGGLRVGLQWPTQPLDVNPIKIAVAGRIQVVASELASNGLRKFQCAEIQKDHPVDGGWVKALWRKGQVDHDAFEDLSSQWLKE